MFAIVNVSIYPVDGDFIEKGAVLVGDDGRITDAGADIDIPGDCEAYDCDGATVYPGFIEAHCHIGINREGLGKVGSHANEATAPITPDMRAFDAVDVQDMHFAKALFDGGVTAACVSPGSANIIGGTTDLISVRPAATASELLMVPRLSVKMAFGENPFRVYGGQNKSPSTRMAVAAVLRRYLSSVEDYRKKKAAAVDEDKHFDIDAEREVILSLLSGELPAHCHAHESIDIETAVRISEEFGYRIVLVHGTGSVRVAGLLRERSIPIILGPQGSFAYKIENRHRSLDTARHLADEGVDFCISTDHPVILLRDLRVEAAKMVNHGLDRSKAIEALTTAPAAILGMSDQLGAIKKGYRADLVVWDGDPLDVAGGKVRFAVVGGRVLTKPTISTGDFRETIPIG